MQSRILRTSTLICILMALLALCLPGCSHDITAPNAAPAAAPNATPDQKRQAMIQWHQQHDKKPVPPAPGG